MKKVTLKDVVRLTKTNSLKSIATLVLECGKCGHKDFLVKFVKLVPEPTSFTTVIRKLSTEEEVLGLCKLKEGAFKPLFYCPVCGSSFVVVDEKELLKEAL